MGETQRTIVQVLHHKHIVCRTGEQFWASLARELRARGWRTVHVAEGEPCEAFAAQLRELNVPYIAAEFPLSVAGAKALGRELRKYRPEVIQTTFISPFSAGLRVLKRESGARRLLLNDYSSGVPSAKRGIKRVLAKLRGALGTGHIDRILALSEFVRRRDIEEAFLPAEKVGVLYHGVDLKRFGPVRRRESGEISIAYAGQLIPEKGVLCLLKAIEMLAREGWGPAFRVRLAGAGAQREELERFCCEKGLGQVEFLGQINWIDRLFAEADIVVIPSEWAEAFGLVVVEAMMCGACVVGSDAGGIPELIGGDGTTGLVFRKGDAEDLKAKLVEVLGDPDRRAAMGAAASARARAMFSMDEMLRQYVGEIERLGEKAEESRR